MFLKTLFTLRADLRYARRMFLIAAAAIAATTPQAQPVRASVEARATVRIIAAARVKLSEDPGPGVPRPRDASIRDNGELRPAKLIEFE
jgi:hypothetical protein